MIDIFERFRITEKVAVVTGGAGLLGAEFCRTLVEAGAYVVAADLDLKAAEALAESLNREAPSAGEGSKKRALPVEVDVGQAASVRDMVRRAVEAFGRLDILVNSAAIDPKFEPDRQARRDGSPEKEAPPSPGSFQPAFENYPLELWKQALDVNLTGAFLCCQAAAGPMLEQGSGVMVNLSSIYGLTGPDQRIYQRNDQKRQFKPVHYSVTKAGLVGLTRYLAAYYAGMNIRVNTLTPGGVYNQHDPEFVAAYASRTILGRMAQKNDLNGALLFLVSEASSYMTGANLIVDGGWTAW